jgi:hypothetical protein
VARISGALATGAAAALYGIPWAVARTYTLGRKALRFSLAAIRLGWKDGLTHGAS